MGGRRRKGKKKKKKKKKNNSTAGGSSSSSPSPPWIELPRDVTANILRRLSPAERLVGAQSVCTTWRSVCCEPSLWRVIDMEEEDHDLYPTKAQIVCLLAVHRSQGELIDVSIEHFCTDHLLQYISDRSSRLKRLSLRCCDFISAQGLTEAVKNFPDLEELRLLFMPSIRCQDIETVGLFCPMLKSLAFLSRSSVVGTQIDDDSYAMSIAKTMPNLRHLRLCRNKLGNEGLEAILHGCPNLESLDIWQCSNVDLQCDLGRRCSEKIKRLTGPLDASADCESEYQVYDFLDNFNGPNLVERC